MSKPGRYTLAVDFDGVLHSYVSPWTTPENIPDEPVPGAIQWLRQMEEHFDIVVHTTRARTHGGRESVRKWLVEAGWEGAASADITDRKVAAIVYIDDRGWRFEGRFPTKQEIHRARPWNMADRQAAGGTRP